MMARPVRLSNLKYYVSMFFMLAAAIYLAFFRSSWFPHYVLLDRWDVYTLVEALLVFIAFVSVIVAEFRRILQLYIVTNLRVIDTSGIVRKKTTVMMTSKIERVYTSQGMLQRLLHYGDVIVDTGEDQIVLGSIARPTQVEGTITQAMASTLPSRR